MLGISIKPTIGVGDALQFSSLPENYYRATGSKLIDVSRPWFFDHNPFVERDKTPQKVQELWNFSPTQYQWPAPARVKELSRPAVYLSNAEIWASVLGVSASLIRPRLYRFEDFPFYLRENVLLHTHGVSHGAMPDHVIEHVVKKYGPTGRLFHVGKDAPDLGIPRVETQTLWDLAQLISKARLFIGVDSGPSWVATCFPDVVVKKVRTKPTLDVLKDWVPLEVQNIHAHWDDRLFQTYNPSDIDIGFTQSYRKL